jgi:hypothetical protein
MDYSGQARDGHEKLRTFLATGFMAKRPAAGGARPTNYHTNQESTIKKLQRPRSDTLKACKNYERGKRDSYSYLVSVDAFPSRRRRTNQELEGRRTDFLQESHEMRSRTLARPQDAGPKSISSRLRPQDRNPALFSAGWMIISVWGGPCFQRRAQRNI